MYNSKDTCSKLAFLKRGWSFTGIATTCNDVRLTPLILMQLFQIRHYMYFPHFPWFCPSFLFENCYFELQYFLYIPLRFRKLGVSTLYSLLFIAGLTSFLAEVNISYTTNYQTFRKDITAEEMFPV